MNVDKLKINKIVEYIRQFSFEYECIEVQEILDSILCDYGIHDFLTSDEKDLVAHELMKMAEAYEISEAIYKMSESMPLLADTGF